MKRSIALLLCALMLCSVCVFSLTACGEVGEGHIDNRTVLKVGSYKVTMDEYLYLCHKFREAYDGGDRSFWDTNPQMEAALMENVLKELCAIYAIYDLADEFDVKLEKEDKETINAIIQSYIDAYESEEAYHAAAQAKHMTGDIVRREETFVLLQQKLFSKLSNEYHGVLKSDDATVETAIAQNEFYCVRYIMVQNRKTDAQSLAKNRAFAEQLRAAAAAGRSMEDVWSLAQAEYAGQSEQFRADPSYQLVSSGNIQRGSYFVKGYLDSATEQQILALADGQVTGVIEQDGYFCFYERVPCDLTYMNGEGFGSLRDLLLQKQFTVLCENKATELRQAIKFRRIYQGAFSARHS